MCMCVLKLLLACMIASCIKESILEEEPTVLNDLTSDGEHLSEDEVKSH
jgi:hypothetical protein